jgi:hypothetical protein
MIDISSISSGINIAKSAYQALDFIREIAGASVISAYFRYDGTRVEGSEKIEIELHPDEKNKAIWWYSVKPVEEYVFIRVPVIESCAHELVGTVAGEPMPDAKFWRWVAPVLPGRIYGGDASNLKVDFLVFGYKPKSLIKHFSSK